MHTLLSTQNVDPEAICQYSYNCHSDLVKHSLVWPDTNSPNIYLYYNLNDVLNYYSYTSGPQVDLRVLFTNKNSSKLRRHLINMTATVRKKSSKVPPEKNCP